MCKKLVAAKSDRDLRGRARGRARRGSRADRAVHELGTVPARKECGGGIRGDTDLDTWHSDAGKWATEADVSSHPVTFRRYELEERFGTVPKIPKKRRAQWAREEEKLCLGMWRSGAATGG